MNIKEQNINLYYYILDCRDIIKKLINELSSRNTETTQFIDLISIRISNLTKEQIQSIIIIATEYRKKEVENLKL
jgi:hypothetical protein